MISFDRRLRWPLALAVIAAAVFAGTAGAGATARSGFPVTLKAADGVVTIPNRPARIVSLSPAATQDLFADGAGKQVVAVDSYSTYPKGVPVTSLNGYSPNVEAIAKYRPDLVVVYVDNDDIVGHLETLHIPVLLEPAATNLSGAYQQIEQLGEATGHAGAAASVVAGMKHKISSIVASVPRPPKPLSVYAEVGTDPYYSVTSATFIGQIISLFGLRNVADRAGGTYTSLSSEYIVASDPDLIILADTVCCGQTPATLLARPGWKTISAVRTGSVLAVNDSIASQWGPTIVEFVADIADAVKKLEASSK